MDHTRTGEEIDDEKYTSVVKDFCDERQNGRCATDIFLKT